MIEIEEIESSSEAKTYAKTYLHNCRITNEYRKQLLNWVGTYLDENMLENIIAYKNSEHWDQPFESIKDEAENDLEIVALYAPSSEHFNIDMMVFESTLLSSFNLLLSRAMEQLDEKVIAH
ncbi:hypothetical protein HNV12_22020 [Methanococcoides sp. SA1]|nr:hypothetical protein [Methanococcoides sp. SA1]